MTPPIVGIGELLWDIYPDGRKVTGGAPFNFAFHCHQLGHEAVIVSRVGDDDRGRELRERVRELGLSDEFIQTDREHPTGTVRVKLDENGVPSYTITENVAWDYIEWDDLLAKLALNCRALCYGSLAQRRGQDKSQQTIARFLYELPQSPQRALRVCDLNLRPPHDDIAWFEPTVFACDWLKLNKAELEILKRRYSGGHRLLNQADAKLLKYFFNQPDGTSARTILITHGEAGVEIHRREDALREPGVPARVIDTVGAGDAFTAAMVCLHLEGMPLRECARFANHYAARVCEHVGATPRINRAEVERAARLQP